MDTHLDWDDDTAFHQQVHQMIVQWIVLFTTADHYRMELLFKLALLNDHLYTLRQRMKTTRVRHAALRARLREQQIRLQIRKADS
jgi:hypothetical protein